MNRARRSFACNFKPCNVVAQFNRQVEASFGFALPRREHITCFADWRALLVERANDPNGSAAVGPQHLDRHLRRGIFGRDQGQGFRRAAFKDGQLPIADGFAQRRDELRAAPGIHPIRQPRELAVARRLQEAFDRRQSFDAFDRIRLWRKLAQCDARGAAGHDGDVTGGLG